jgi:delta 1-pyrroline-5-carboxylate dehydrogenase
VLCADADRAAQAAARVSGREGRRIPVIEPESRRWAYPAWRLRVERSISENTTASGGNAALLASVS